MNIIAFTLVFLILLVVFGMGVSAIGFVWGTRAGAINVVIQLILLPPYEWTNTKRKEKKSCHCTETLQQRGMYVNSFFVVVVGLGCFGCQ